MQIPVNREDRTDAESLVPLGEVSHEVMAHFCGNKCGSSPTADCRCVICDIGKMLALDIPKGPHESRSNAPNTVIHTDFTGAKIASARNNDRDDFS